MHQGLKVRIVLCASFMLWVTHAYAIDYGALLNPTPAHQQLIMAGDKPVLPTQSMPKLAQSNPPRPLYRKALLCSHCQSLQIRPLSLF